jgi:hypothetical protein
MKSRKLNKTLLIIAVGVIVSLTACQSLVPFTNVERTRYNFTNSDLKKMQFYISREVTIQRGEKGENNQQIDEDGKLVVSTSASIDEITIDAKTEGICVKVLDGNKLAISFWDEDSKYLVFGDPNNRGRYTIMGATWKNGKGKINFDGKVYYIMPGGAGAYLKFEKVNKKDYKKTTSKAKGRKVN